MAIWALVLVIVLGAIGALVGIPLAFAARSKVRQSHGALQGSGLALAALIIGFAYVALIGLAIAIPTFIGVTHPSATGSAPPVASAQAASASAIGLQAGDLGPGFTATSTPDAVTAHAVPGPCTPLSGGPWLAYQSSPYFTSGSGDLTVTSDVVVMPSFRDARSALTAISAPSYGESCFLPSTNASVTRGLASLGTSCGLSLQNPGITGLAVPTPNGSLGGYHYSADILCARSGTSEPYVMDIVDQVVGATFLQARFRAIGTPPPAALEEQVMQRMAARAASVNP